MPWWGWLLLWAVLCLVAVVGWARGARALRHRARPEGGKDTPRHGEGSAPR